MPRKLMAMNCTLHTRAYVDRLYFSRRESGGEWYQLDNAQGSSERHAVL